MGKSLLLYFFNLIISGIAESSSNGICQKFDSQNDFIQGLGCGQPDALETRQDKIQ
jgi:hypothetical protein